MKQLPPPDSHHLRAAQGWLELGNAREAEAELARIAPPLRLHPDVFEVRWHIHARAREWERCVEIANASVQLDRSRPESWIHRSFALHELKRTQDAFDQLRPVANRFSGVWMIPYNLACYCAQLGRLEDARTWLRKAMALDTATVRRAAAEDPDLAPLRDHPGGLTGAPPG